MGVAKEPLDLLPGTLDLLILRTLLNGWVKAEWGVSENNRRARYYTLTAAGRKRLTAERQEFDQLILGIQKILHAT